jgi:hypothetical protein
MGLMVATVTAVRVPRGVVLQSGAAAVGVVVAALGAVPVPCQVVAARVEAAPLTAAGMVVVLGPVHSVAMVAAPLCIMSVVHVGAATQ